MGGFVKDLLSAGKSLIPGIEKEAEPLLKKTGDILEQKGEQFMKGLHDEQALNSIRKDVKFHPAASDIVGQPKVVDKGIVKKGLDVQKADLPPNFFKDEYKNGIDAQTKKVIHRAAIGSEESVKSYQKLVQQHTAKINELDKFARESLEKKNKLFEELMALRLPKKLHETTPDWKVTETKDYIDYKNKKAELTKMMEQHYQDYFSAVAERRDVRRKMNSLSDPYIGELRELTNGQHIMWLGKNAMAELSSALDPIGGSSYTLNGVRLKKDQAPQILNRIVRWVSNQDTARGLIRLFNEAAQKTSGEVFIVASKQNRGIRFAIDTVREELLHDWQGSLSGGEVRNHLKPEAFSKLAQEVPTPLLAEMTSNKYETNNPVLAVFEASAKILSGSVEDKTILKHPETAKFITKYFEEVEKEHGVDALERIRYAINDFKKMRDAYVESKRAIESEAAKGQ
jgi:hypothetical protein